MPCTYESKGKYEFFEHIDEYINYESLSEQNGIRNSSDVNCIFRDYDNVKNNHMLSGMCQKFINLVNFLFKEETRFNYNKDHIIDYLNYWFNYKLNEIDDDNICKKDFFQALRFQNLLNSNLPKLRSGIYDIEAEEFQRMNTLYNLYDNFNKLNKKIKENNPKEEEYMTYAKNCIKEYQKFNESCTGDGEKFCKILSNFKIKYEAIDLCKYTFEEKMRKKLPSLESDPNKAAEVCEASVIDTDVPSPQDKSVYSESDEGSFDIDTQSITIGSVATVGMSIIFVMLYKFTSIGQFLRSQMNKNERVWENLDEEMNPFSHANEYEHFNSENKMYGIAYNS
ncbi:Plasmodium variant antigen protein Cir/Yir/Bir/Plasmodium vivax Vir protein, putative [Plasmodium ovale]|uniref:Plasmodium variant antigen protein Cir/Yir/Bir/Plasmodium vivax Vir protein, putative n=1 Tax=Plasmodium ovale TaxID=36330 RepID=A0A1C3KGE5_PLAOA|nr:Plasmodium variant antigen protein Cir/Yir/Bir/Plasmodium vivax Vir protein, putative [Plasmodium ovale]